MLGAAGCGGIGRGALGEKCCLIARPSCSVLAKRSSGFFSINGITLSSPKKSGPTRNRRCSRWLCSVSPWLPSRRSLEAVSGTVTLDALARLVERVPCWHLELGRDLDAVPRRIEHLLAGAAGP